MNAILVSVDYSDILALTLPYNRCHFDEVMVVSNYKDRVTADIAMANHCHLYRTDAFYEKGAAFNKWLALEQGLDVLGRKGWLCIMDADVLWPKVVGSFETKFVPLKVGNLMTPMRRMWDNWPELPRSKEAEQWKFEGSLPDESEWSRFPLHRQQQEFAGYSQIFHADDPRLGEAPWHQIDWKHAGGADSFFQAKWPQECKVRPPFEVLHLGPAGQNWFGRATPMANGSLLAGAEEKRDMSGRIIWEQRRKNRAEGRDQFDGERIR